MKISLIHMLQKGQNSGCLLHQCLLPKIYQVCGWTLERFCHLPGLDLVSAPSFLSHSVF